MQNRNLRIVEAVSEEHFAAISRILAQGWRTTYADAIPKDFMDHQITDDRWVAMLRENFQTRRRAMLLLYDGNTPVCCATFGQARTEAGAQAGSVCKFNLAGYENWGEVISFYTSPAHKGKGYGSLLMEAVLNRLRAAGYQNVFLYVLRENGSARRFYEKMGFAWDGTQEEIPFPPDTVCIDLRYTRTI